MALVARRAERLENLAAEIGGMGGRGGVVLLYRRGCAMVSGEDTFGNAVAARSVAEMVAILRSLSSDHAGTPNAATMSRALKLIRAAAAGESRYELACGLADADSCAAQELGAVLLADVYSIHAAEVEAVLCRLADSESWEVRQRTPDRAEPLLRLAGALLTDRDAYVRKNLGAAGCADCAAQPG